MEDIETTYINMLGTDSVENHVPAYMYTLKNYILKALPHLKSCLQENRRRSAVLYFPQACEEGMLHSAMKIFGDDEENMKTLYKAAQVLRKTIENFFKSAKDTNGIEVTSSIQDVPPELYTMMRWIMMGPTENLETEKRTKIVERSALTLSQNIIFGFKSNRQVLFKPKEESTGFRPPLEWCNPQFFSHFRVYART